VVENPYRPSKEIGYVFRVVHGKPDRIEWPDDVLYLQPRVRFSKVVKESQKNIQSPKLAQMAVSVRCGYNPMASFEDAFSPFSGILSVASEATQILVAISAGDRSDTDRLMEIVYGDFRKLAGTYLADETKSNTLQPTAVVHEAFMKLVDHRDVDWRGRSHFFAVGATAMRQILVDHARKKSTQKRGAGHQRVLLDEQLELSPRREADVLALDDALGRLAAIDERRAKIVEMRFFAGMTEAEVAVALGVSKSTVEKQWAATSRWLRRELSEDPGA
jgi:RNA polymerase sigma-70 factor (ECF subfamily)